MVEIIVPIGVCVVLPVMVVWLVFRSRNHIVDRKAEVLLKAIENGQDIDPEIFSTDNKSGRSLKMNLLGKLQAGIILVISYLTIPQAVAGMFYKNFTRQLWLSTLVSCLGSLIGLFLSVPLNTPSGVTIVLVFLVIFIVCYICKRH